MVTAIKHCWSKTNLYLLLRFLRHLALVGLVVSIVAIQAFAKKNSNYPELPLQQENEMLLNDLRPFIGQCLHTRYDKKYPRFNVYEAKVVPYWKKSFEQNDFNSYVLGNLMQIYGISPEEIVSIDILARTIYSEMDKGFERGLHYARALAAVILNRAEVFENEERGHNIFVPRKRNFEYSSGVTHVVMARKQFSAWDGVIGGKSNPVLTHALCPPTSRDKFFWRSFTPENRNLVKWKRYPSKKEIHHWELSVRVAMEALLEDDKFWAHFKDHRHRVVGRDAFKVYYYTSGYYSSGARKGQRVTIATHPKSKSGGLKIVRGPIISGRGDFDERLLRFWAPVKKL